MEQKKTYTPPTVTDHGKATTKTQGIVSTSYETFGYRAFQEEPKPPDEQ